MNIPLIIKIYITHIQSLMRTFVQIDKCADLAQIWHKIREIRVETQDIKLKIFPTK